MNLKRMLSLFYCGLLGMQLMAAGPESAGSAGNNNPAATNAGAPISVKEIQELRRKIAEQQKQIEQLQKSVAEQESLLDRTVQAVAASTSTNAAAAPAQLQTVSDAGRLPLALTPAARAGQGAEKTMSSPLSFKIGDAAFTPFGFVDMTYVGRSTNVGSGIGSNFAGIPYNNVAPGKIGENTLSTQNSRIGFRVDSTVLGAKVLGYFEADFLGNQPTNVFVTSNSDTFRMRNVFVDINKGKFEVMGGQDWSLMTPGKKGISPVPSDLFFTQNMDTNYQLGLTWARQTQFRVAYHPNEHWHMALSVEDPQQYVGGSSGAPTITYPAAYSANTGITNQFNSGANSYSVPNVAPDFIFKGAYDAKPKGLLQHVEVVGLLRNFKYYNPTLNNSQGKDFTATGGGGSVNGNFEIFKNFHLIANTFFSDGGGRYVFGMAPDLIVRPDGNMSLIHTYSTVDGFETNLTKNLLLYSYYGGTYVGKNVAIDTNGKQVGYGSTGSTNGSQNRSLQEFTIGLTPTLWKSPQYGALQLITQYSYVWRNPWYLTTGSPKDAKTNMVFIDLRYTIP
jgi:uncharacterized coiled-coil protein SlyX